jgi:hypothetical protein
MVVEGQQVGCGVSGWPAASLDEIVSTEECVCCIALGIAAGGMRRKKKEMVGKSWSSRAHTKSHAYVYIYTYIVYVYIH